MKICDHVGCNQEANTYQHAGDAVDWCDEHAASHGFCPGCGFLVAGNEWDDLHMRRYGLCYECVDELNAETGAYFMDEDGYTYEVGE